MEIDMTDEQLKVLKDLEEASKNHDSKTCTCDCCILCFSEANKAKPMKEFLESLIKEDK